MVSTAIVTLYKRSVEKNGLHYDPFIRDEDSSSYRRFCKANGKKELTKPIGKKESFRHAKNRMVNQQRPLVRDWKGKKSC